jgi:nicotinamide riboside transporter PnuC
MAKLFVYSLSLIVIVLSSFIVQLVDSTLGLIVGIVGVLVAFLITVQSLVKDLTK